jgi:hypothetical protein
MFVQIAVVIERSYLLLLAHDCRVRGRGSLCPGVPVHIDFCYFFKTRSCLLLLFLIVRGRIKVHTAFTYRCQHLTIQSNGLIVLKSVIVFHEFSLLMVFLDHIIVCVVPCQKMGYAAILLAG